MILFHPRLALPVEIRAGDILFIAGCRHPADTSAKLHFEHVAIAAEKRVIWSADEFIELPVYGMPESDLNSVGSGIAVNNGHYWSTRRWLGSEMGSKDTVWNLAVRSPSFDETVSAYLESYLALLAGSFDCTYGTNFSVDTTLRGPLQTNCLGFVCSVIERFGAPMIAHNLPIYPSPYILSDVPHRDFPSPGHLAKAGRMVDGDLPYRPTTSSEATHYARVDITIDEIFGFHPKGKLQTTMGRALSGFLRFLGLR